MSGDTTLQALKRLSWLPDRDASENGTVIAGQEYYDVEFAGGSISNVTLTDVTINGVDTERTERVITDSGDVTVLSDDYVITLDKSVPEATAITLPSAPTTSRSLIIKDGNGSAGTYAITLDGNGNTIDGSATFVMGTNWEAVEIIYNGSEWNLISSYGIGGGGGGGSGTVTSVSVVTANGISGSVANATTTPAITLDISGLDASKIADGSVNNTTFQYLNGVTSGIQTQLNSKLSNITGLVTEGSNISITGSGTSGDPYQISSDVSGTVTTVSVVTANGFSGTVSNATSTPAITINASGLDAAKIADGSVSNTEYQYLNGVTSSIQTQLSDKLENITGLVTQGTNVSITGTGTSGDPYVIASTGGSGGGDVSGPASATNNAVATFDGTTGKLIQNSSLIYDGDLRGMTTATLPNDGLHILDTNASHDLIISPGSDLSADRTLTITTGDANRTLTLSGNFTGSGTATGTNTGDQTITLTGDITGSGTGSFATSIAAGAVVDADVNASAAIALSKLAATTANRALVSNGSGVISAATTTATEIGYVNGVTSAIQTQLDGKQPDIQFQNDGVNEGTSGGVSTINFAGDGVTASESSGTLTVTIAGGGSSAFSALTSGTNTTAAMVVGTGASLGVSGSGTISATSAPLSGISGLGTGVATFLGTPSSANLAAAVTDETGTGALVFANSPVFTTPNIGSATGSVSGNAGTATALQTARTIGGVSFDGTANIVPQTIQIVDAASDTTTFPMLATSATGSLQPTTDAGLTYNASTNALTATTFVGALSGNATTATTATTATNVTAANEGTDTTCFPLFAISATGSVGPKTNASLTYNSSTGALGSTSFVGALTGNASTATALQTPRTINGTSFDGTANITVTAAAGTLTGTTLAAGITSSSLTSVGTLTGGATGSGFTVALGSSTITGQLALANGGTGAALTDPNADRILFWDDSAGAVTWLTAGTGLSISGTTISATGSGDVTAASNLTDNALVRGDGGAKGVQTSGIIIADTTDAVSGIGTITPKANNAQQLGSTSNQWADLFLGTGGVINWNNGGVTITETSDSLQFAGASGYDFDSSINGSFTETLWIPAAAMRPSASGGCAPLALTATGSNQPDLSYLAFDPTTAEYAQFSVVMPSRWSTGSSLIYYFYWTHPATTTNFGVNWNIQAVGVSNDDPIGASYNSPVSVSDTGGTTNDLYITALTSSTVSASTADEIFFRVFRDPGNVNDTLAVDAYLLGVKIRYLTTTLSDNS